MTAALSLIFFASGASALVFETLWFHQAGLALGNSVWASSLVLAGFMGGLALGNALAARWGDRLADPVRSYAYLEVAIAVTGTGLVFGLPALARWLAPALRPLEGQLWLLNTCRLVVAFGALLVPSTAMGLTLPLLTRALTSAGAAFGRVLGGLYGWNTLGAVLGAVIAETHLIGALGIRGTALVAASANMGAAAGAWLLARRSGPARVPPPGGTAAVRPGRAAHPWLVAAFVSGFLLLALEIVWFRFLGLFVLSRSLSFAVMLAIVLAGIAVGGFAAARWLARCPAAHVRAGGVAFAAGACCIASYAAAPLYLAPFGTDLIVGPGAIARVGVPLMFPAAFLSGVFFTLAGAALRAAVPSDSVAVGALTFANTTGAAIGSLMAGFVLLPWLGMEASVYLAALVYGGVGVLLLATRPTQRGVACLVSAAVFAAAVAAFPFGTMETRHLRIPIQRWLRSPEDRVELVREGVVETLIYVDQRILGTTHSHRLITNALSMASSDNSARRYMNLYVYLPVALHPDPRRALLVSYGLGSTAEAVTATASFASIDIVDISRDILELSPRVRADSENPLADPRVTVHVEDGRYFLQSTRRRFDLITGEPPPPAANGVVNLYTREYFELVYDRLADGGMFSYWLPIHSVSEPGSRAILRAFCDVFADCTLWHGVGRDLMLLGTRGASQRVSAEQFARQWRDPKIASELTAVGFERPEQLGALFIGDATYLNEVTRNDAPLVDDFPKRVLGPTPRLDQLSPLHASWTDTDRARERFRSSAFVAALWPPELREASLPYFDSQRIINALTFGLYPPGRSRARDTHTILSETSLHAPALWLLGSNADFQRIVAEADDATRADPNFQYQLGVGLVAQRRFDEALEPLRLAEQNPGNFALASAVRIFALCEAGRRDEAHRLANERAEAMSRAGDMRDYWAAMQEIFGLAPPAIAIAHGG